MKINTKNLKLAEMRYYDAKRKGVELTEPVAYSLLLKTHDSYINIFNMEENFPVFSRANIANDYRGESYGNKMELVSSDNTLVSGPCYIIETEDIRKNFNTDVVNINEVEKFMIYSPLYFKDRKEIIDERSFKMLDSFKLKKIMLNDKLSDEFAREFFGQRMVTEETKVKVKK